MKVFYKNNSISKVLLIFTSASMSTQGYSQENSIGELRKEVISLREEVQNIRNKSNFENDSKIDVYGFIRSDATYQASGAATMYNNISAVPLENTPEANKQEDQLHTTVSATRIGANFIVGSSKGEIKAKLEADFFGGSTRDQFRIRHAYISLDKWLIGQTWSNFVAPENMPETLDPAAYVGGSLLRVPLVKYTHNISDKTGIVLSVEDPKYSTYSDPDNKMRIPALVSRINHKFDNGSLITGRTFLAEKKTSQDKILSWGVGFGGKYQIAESTNLKLDYYHVYGDGRFVSWSNSGYVIEDQGKMHANQFDSISLGATHYFTPKLRSTLGYGIMTAKDNSRFAKLKYDDTTQNKELWQGWLNTIYSPVKSVNLGIEYVYGERETFESLRGIDNRFNVMMSYDF